MELSTLGYREMFRSECQDDVSCHTERLSVDFMVNGRSMREMFDNACGSETDMMGCIVSGYPAANLKARSRLTCQGKPNGREDRVLLYICPECGDIDCGAYAVRIERVRTSYIWSSFAHESESGTRLVELPGPFTFDALAYERVLADATSHFSR